ncbi:MAG TPA: hypothetical protein VK452_04935 [Dissulfurispiraceae bacterium]|nr:hypothetical protein [Dissulfurispiraceae bacterium]
MESLPEVIEFLGGVLKKDRCTVDIKTAMAENSLYEDDFCEVKGQEHAKRALRQQARIIF